MKKTLILLVVFLMFFPGGAGAQEPIHFNELVIELWPEYDQPDVLVIYRAFLASDVSLPAEITFQIPADAGQPHAVAVRDANNQLVTVQYQRVVRGEVAEVIFTATSREIQFEYYDQGLLVQDQEREFVYQWPGVHQVDAAVIQLQQPRGAEDLTTNPPLGNTFAGSDGLTYYYQDFEFERGEPLEITVHYQKQDDTLTIREQPVQPSVPLEANPSFSLQGRGLLPWILGGVGVLLILGAVFLYWDFGSSNKLSKNLSGVFSSSRRSPSGGFCPQCGTPRDEGDRFCRSCGERL
ncbi:MAG: zinc ribbon domain-containing protein [Anaerolineales bacterium]|nr:zinc ribbon domain-containing protein [Anaerolineales bacterium]